jgi:hypothetical protein
MRIQFRKGASRHELRCYRADGTSTSAPTGPGLPHHDLCHYVAERALGLRGGFWGAIAGGRALSELSDREVIPTLGRETMVAEVLARALGAVKSGACPPDEMAALAGSELGEDGREIASRLSAATVEVMSAELGDLLARWQALSVGESLLLEWPA